MGEVTEIVKIDVIFVNMASEIKFKTNEFLKENKINRNRLIAIDVDRSGDWTRGDKFMILITYV